MDYRRRLPVQMVKLRMAQTLGDAAKFVEQGRILIYSTTSLDTALVMLSPSLLH